MPNLSHPDVVSSDSNVARIVGGVLGSVLLIVTLACILIPIIVAMVKHEIYDNNT